jgi:hypothetical protein
MGIGYRFQHLILNADQFRCGTGVSFRLGHHNRHYITDVVRHLSDSDH